MLSSLDSLLLVPFSFHDQAYEKPDMVDKGNMFWNSSSPEAMFNFHKICVWQLMILRPVLGAIVVATHKYQISTIIRIIFLVSMVLAMRTLSVMYRGTSACLQQACSGIGMKFLIFKGFVLVVLVQDSLFAIGIKQGRILPDELDPDAAGTRVMSILVVLEAILFLAGFWYAYGADDDLIHKSPLRAAPEPIGYVEALGRLFKLWDLFDIDDSSMIALAADESGTAALAAAGDSVELGKPTSIVTTEPSAAVEMMSTSSAQQSSD
jgi:hypothetical protein